MKTLISSVLLSAAQAQIFPDEPYIEASLDSPKGLCDNEAYKVIDTMAECEVIRTRKYQHISNLLVKNLWGAEGTDEYPGGCFIDANSEKIYFNAKLDSNNPTTSGTRQLCRLNTPEEEYFVSTEDGGVCKSGFVPIIEEGPGFCFLALSLQFPDYHQGIKNYWGEEGTTDWPAGCFWFNGEAFYNKLTDAKERLALLRLPYSGSAEKEVEKLGSGAWTMFGAKRVCREKQEKGVSPQEAVARKHARENSATPPVPDHSACSPFTCADWQCPQFCGCFAEVPEMDSYFKANPLVQALCPDDGQSNCDCFELAEDWKTKTEKLLEEFKASDFDAAKYLTLKKQMESIEEYEPLLADIIGKDAQYIVDQYEDRMGVVDNLLVPTNKLV